MIVIKNGKLIAEFDQITDKWNNKIKNEDILHSRNEVQKVLLSLEKERSLNLVLDRVEQLGQLPLFVDIKNKAVKLAVENRLKKSPQSKRKIHWK